MQTIQIEFTLYTNTEQQKLIRNLLTLLDGEDIVNFSFSSDLEETEEETYEEKEEEESERREFTYLDWKDPKTIVDLKNMSCKGFCGKYSVSGATYYLNRRKMKEIPTLKRSHYVSCLKYPRSFQKEFGYSDKELSETTEKAKIMLSRYYDDKYDGVLGLAGRFPDSVVGKKYSISGATIWGIRQLLQIPPAQKRNNGAK